MAAVRFFLEHQCCCMRHAETHIRDCGFFPHCHSAKPAESKFNHTNTLRNCAEDALSWLEHHWPKEKRGKLRPVLKFFIDETKKDVKKTQPLCHLLTVRIEKKGILKSSQGRHMFINAWAENRSKRFVAKPQIASKKLGVAKK